MATNILKIFIGEFDYKKQYRRYLVDLVKPLFPIYAPEKYDISSYQIKIVQNYRNSDVFLFPYSWNYYLELNKTKDALKFIKLAQENKKYVILFVTGDYFHVLPENKYLISLHTSYFKTIPMKNSFPLPVVINDPLQFLKLKTIKLGKYNFIPSIGFCGQVDSNTLITIMKLINRSYDKLKFFLKNYKVSPEMIYPPTTLRKKILLKIIKSNKIKTDFIQRSKYKGGVFSNGKNYLKIRREYYENILNSNYTLCIRGTGNFSTRLYDTLALGRIPVFINTDCVLPFENEINWEDHIVWVEKNDLNEIGKKISDFHNGLDKDDFIQLQITNRLLWENYFSFPGLINQLVNFLNEKLKT
jgi:hypothetical protein